MGRKSAGVPFTLFAFQDIITSVTGIFVLILLILVLELTQRKSGSPVEIESKETVKDLAEGLAAAKQQVESLAKRVKEAQSSINAAVARPNRDTNKVIVDAQEQTARLDEELKALERRRDKLQQMLEGEKSKLQARAPDVERLKQLADQMAAVELELEKLKKSNRIVYQRAGDQTHTAWLVDLAAARILAAPVGEARPPLVFDNANFDRRIGEFLAWASRRSTTQEYFLLLVRPDGIDAYYKLEEALLKNGFKIGLDLIDQDETAIDPVKGAGT